MSTVTPLFLQPTGECFREYAPASPPPTTPGDVAPVVPPPATVLPIEDPTPEPEVPAVEDPDITPDVVLEGEGASTAEEEEEEGTRPTAEGVSKMRVAELRQTAKDLGIPSTGRKAEIRKRIVSFMEQMDEVVV